MTTAMRRSIGMITATALLVAGCSAGQGDPKVALTVGDAKVSTVEQIQRTLNDLLATNQAVQDQARQHKLDQVSRGIVGQQAINQLAADAARRLGIQITDAQAEAAIPVLTGPGATQSDPFQSIVDAAFQPKDLARARLALAEVGRRALGRSSVTFDAVVLQDADAAVELARKIAENPAQSTALIQAAPEAMGEPFLNSVFGPEAALQDPSNLLTLAASPYYNVPAGEVIATRLTGNQGGYLVLFMKARRAVTPPAEVTIPELKPVELAQIGQGQLTLLASVVPVQPNPRFGKWDPVTLKVVSGEEATNISTVFQAKSTQP
ncbi:hypothetical protein LWC34_38535 [Kibdelosporangium philippinense]|uniref:PpiC domain-containing protein n=1 Tax=Kibdelosporangium philippinense TaxID=211113 RepID=A0ABS8ZLK5_9PSEU|nr:hypothetical protein [Kibdelosporangium philippinense]MCE7008670.1 hypothetical protein [Kibdelosporangium philippinense]